MVPFFSYPKIPERTAGPSDHKVDDRLYYAALAEAFLRGRGDTGRAKLHRFKRKSGPPRVTGVLARLQGLCPEGLLDIGPGRGAFLWPLAARFPDLEIHAVDVLAHRVRDIDAVRVGGIARLSASRGSVSHLPFNDGAFDIVTILEVLEHLRDPAAAAAEVLRVARRFVIASVPSHEDDNPQHLRCFTRNELTDLFLDAGARRVQVDYVRGHMIAVIR